MKTVENIDFSFTQAQADEVLTKHLGVYIYGVGETIHETIEFLCDQKIPIFGILDRNPVYTGVKMDGINVYPPEYLTDLNIPVIICARLRYDEIYQYLKQRGCSCVLPFYFYKKDQIGPSERYRKALAGRHQEIQQYLEALPTDDPLIFESLDVVLTERCSLRCKDCANLMQYYAHPEHEDFAVQMNALDSIMGAVDFVQELRVLGGEPFVSPDFSQYISHMLQYENVGTIVIYTNATILPKGEALECLKNRRVFVRISDYGPVSRKLRELQKLLWENHVLYETVECKKWLDCSGFQKRERTPEELKTLFKGCCGYNIYSLKSGKLYVCPYVANAAALHAIPSDAIQAVATDLPQDELRHALRKFVEMPYFEACKYCAGRPRMLVNIPAAIQTDTPLPYEFMESSERKGAL